MAIQAEKSSKHFFHNVFSLEPIKNKLSTSASKVQIFIKNNWKQTLAALGAWILVVVALGVITGFRAHASPGNILGAIDAFKYGFKAVSLPMTIGMAIGLGVGCIMGLLTVKIFDPKNKYSGKNTPWDCINTVINKVGSVKRLAQSVALSVAVLLAAIYPGQCGFMFGCVIGWQLVSNIAFGKPLGPTDTKSNSDQKEADSTIKHIQDLRAENQQQAAEIQQQATEIQGLKDQVVELQDIKTRLEKLESANT